MSEVTMAAAWVPSTGVVYFAEGANPTFPEDTTALGTFKHDGASDAHGHVGSHVLIHHIQDLLYKVGEFDLQRITLMPAPVEEPDPEPESNP